MHCKRVRLTTCRLRGASRPLVSSVRAETGSGTRPPFPDCRCSHAQRNQREQFDAVKVVPRSLRQRRASAALTARLIGARSQARSPATARLRKTRRPAAQICRLLSPPNRPSVRSLMPWSRFVLIGAVLLNKCRLRRDRSGARGINCSAMVRSLEDCREHARARACVAIVFFRGKFQKKYNWRKNAFSFYTVG